MNSPLELRRARARLERRLHQTREELRENLERLAQVSTAAPAGASIYRKPGFIRRHPLAAVALVATAVGATLWAFGTKRASW